MGKKGWFIERSLIPINGFAIIFILSSIFLKSLILVFFSKDEYLLENDSTRYLDLASNFFQNFVVPDGSPNPDAFYVTPGYPLFVFLFSSLGIKVVIFIQFCILAATQFLLYQVLRNLFSARVALLGLCFFVLESSTNLESFHILTETLFSLFFVLFLYFFSRIEKAKLIPLLTGVILGLSVLVRPVAQILIFALIVTTILAKQKKEIGVCLLMGVLVLSSWSFRNHKVFDVPQVSGIQSLNLLYFEGAGAASIAMSQTLGETQSFENQREASILGESPSLNELVSYRQDRGFSLIKENLGGFIQLHIVGAIKILVGPGSATIDKITSDLAYGEILGKIIKVMSFLFSLLLTLLSFFSIWKLSRLKLKSINYFYIFVAISFLLLLISSGGANAYSRFRVPLVPLEIILSMYALSLIKGSFARRKNHLTPSQLQ